MSTAPPAPRGSGAVRTLARSALPYTRRKGLLVWVPVSAAASSICEAGSLVALTAAATTMAADEPNRTIAGWTLSRGGLLAIAAGLLAVRLLLVWSNTSAVMALASEGLLAARRRLLSAFVGATYDRQAEQPPAQLQELLSTRADLVGLAMTILGALVVASMNLLVLTTTALVLQPVAVLGMLAVGGCTVVGLRLANRRTRRLSAAYLAESDEFIEQVHDLTTNARDVLAFGVGGEFLAALEPGQHRMAALYRRVRTLGTFVPNLYQTVGLGLAVGGLAVASTTGVTDLAVLGAVVLLLLRGVSYGQQLVVSVQNAEDRVPYVLSLTASIDRLEASPRPRGSVVPARVDLLDVDDLRFSYAAGPPALDGVSLTIRRGETVGIVGASGSGKTTLLHILAGLRHAEPGRVRVNGTALEDLDPDWWHRTAALVPQDAHLVGATLERNVAFFRRLPGDDVARAVEQAQLGTDVAQIGGLDAPLGRHGRSLSGGQVQRLAIARALAGHPEVLFLDEPTSALDVRTEQRLQDVFQEIRSGLTMVIVAHRLSTVASCDRVLVMSRGRIVADGPPEVVLSRFATETGSWGLLDVEP